MQEQGSPYIEAFDEFGRPIRMTREQWRDNVLIPGMKAASSDQKKLHDQILAAIRQDFIEEVLEPAQHLLATALDEDDRIAALILLSYILRHLSRPQDSKALLESELENQRGNALLLTNLALAEEALGHDAECEQLLWQALEADPNYQDALMRLIWRHGPSDRKARKRVLDRANTLNGAWRPLLWFGHFALGDEDLTQALGFYREAVRRNPRLPDEAIAQMSGDLGKKGHFQAAIDLCGRLLDPATCDIGTAGNLLQCYINLDQSEPARALLEKLYSRKRDDWQSHLKHWEAAISKLKHRFGELPAPPIEWTTHVIPMPLWRRSDPTIESLLPTKQQPAVTVGVVISSVHKEDRRPGKVRFSGPDLLGGVSRAIPLFLADQVATRTDAHGRFVCVLSPDGSFILPGGPTSVAATHSLAESMTYVLLPHIDASESPWILQANLVHSASQTVVATWQEMIDPERCHSATESLSNKLLHWLALNAGVQLGTDIAQLAPPAGIQLLGYLYRMQQMLAIRATVLAGSDGSNLVFERNILDEALIFLRENPANAAARLLVLGCYEEETRRRPDIGAEYWRKVERTLQKLASLPNVEQASKWFLNSAQSAME